MKFEVDITVGIVEADSEEEALSGANQLLTILAESNTGSEVLANAQPRLYLKKE